MHVRRAVMKCANCGAEVEAGHFCEKCGASLIREIEISRDTGQQEEALAQGNGAETVFIPDMIRTTEVLPGDDPRVAAAENEIAENAEGVVQVKQSEALVLQENPETAENTVPEQAETKPKKKKRKSVFLRKEVEVQDPKAAEVKETTASEAKPSDTVAALPVSAKKAETQPEAVAAELQPVEEKETAAPEVPPVETKETTVSEVLPVETKESAVPVPEPVEVKESVPAELPQTVEEKVAAVQELPGPAVTEEVPLPAQPLIPETVAVPDPAVQMMSREIPVQPAPPVAETPKKKKKKSGLKGFFVFLFFLAILGAGGYVAYRYYTDPARNALEQLEKGNIETAMYYFGRIGSNNMAGQKQFTDEALKRVRDVYNKYLAGSLSYEETCRIISKYQEGSLWSNDEIRDLKQMTDELEQSRAAYESGLRLKDLGNYGEALLEFEKVIKEDSAYEASKTAIIECLDLCRENALTQAGVYEDAEMYEEAIAVIDEAMELLPSDAELSVERALCVKRLGEKTGDAVIAKAEEMIGKDPASYKTARDHLDEYLKQNPDDQKVKTKRDEYDKAYYKGMLKAAEECAAEKKYDEAIGILEGLAEEYPEEKEIGERIAQYTARKPVKLVDLEAYELLGKGAGTVYFDETAEDTFENRWSNAIGVRDLFSSNLDPFNNFQSVGYIVNSKYDHFHCVLAYERTENTLGNTIVEFVVDDEVIYRTKGIKKTTKPITIDLDLPEGQIFTIRFVNNKKEECADIIVAEAEFTNTGKEDVIEITKEDETEEEDAVEADEAGADGTEADGAEADEAGADGANANGANGNDANGNNANGNKANKANANGNKAGGADAGEAEEEAAGR